MDNKLLKKFLAGDRHQVNQAISVIYDELAKKFLGHLYKRSIPEDDIDDIIQTVFIKIAEKPKLIANADEVFPYIWRIFFNCFNEHLRAKQMNMVDQVENDIIEQQAGSYVESDILLESCMGEAMKALRNKSYDEALVIELSTINGWALKDVATFLDKTYGATREYVSQARKKLQELILRYCGDDVLIDVGVVG